MKFEPEYSYERLISTLRAEGSKNIVSKNFFYESEKLIERSDWSVDITLTRRSALKIFKLFLNDKNDFNLSNQFLLEFYQWYKSQGYKKFKLHGHQRCVGSIRALCLGLYNLPFELFPLRTIQKLDRLSNFSETTLEMILYYEKNGSHLKTDTYHKEENGKIIKCKQYKRTVRKLSQRSIFNRLGRLIQFLKLCNVNCLTKVSKEMVEQKIKEAQNKDTFLKHILEIEGVFGNLEASGFILKSPIGAISYDKPRSNINNDILKPDDIDRLKQMSVHMEDMDPVDARTLMFILLSYDTAMRIGETLLLNKSDVIKEKEEVTILLKGENQKGTGKINRYLLLLFPEVSFCLQQYILKVRTKFNPQSDGLFLGKDGFRINHNQMNTCLKNFCEKHSISTFKRKKVTSHVLRHTFASLNIEPLGLRLSLDQVISRLRHKDRTLAEKVYILDNPYMEKMKHRERLLAHKSSHEKFWSIPKETFLAWLKDELKLDNETINNVESSYRLNQPGVNSKVKALGINKTMSEDDSIVLLKQFKIKVKALRKYCVENSLCSEYKGNFKYCEEFIWKLNQDFISSEEAIKRLKFSRASFFRLRSNFEVITVGRVSLVNKKSVVSYLKSK